MKKWGFVLVLAVLVFLAVSSGFTKILLMKQDVEFFGRYGFTTPILITFGAAQLLGGLLIGLARTRIYGAGIVAVTFAISAVVLYLDGNSALAAITIGVIIVLLMVMVHSFQSKRRG